jgi:hypothetical protein
MSFVELSNAMFRGTLKAATGAAKFKLTAQAINAVDTVNINYNQVTYDRLITYSRTYQAAGSILAAMELNIPDSSAWVEIVAHGTYAGGVSVDGSWRANRNLRAPNQPMLPFVELISLSQGQHTVQLHSSGSGASSGLILCRYIRSTGG